MRLPQATLSTPTGGVTHSMNTFVITNRFIIIFIYENKIHIFKHTSLLKRSVRLNYFFDNLNLAIIFWPHYNDQLKNQQSEKFTVQMWASKYVNGLKVKISIHINPAILYSLGIKNIN